MTPLRSPLSSDTTRAMKLASSRLSSMATLYTSGRRSVVVAGVEKALKPLRT